LVGSDILISNNLPSISGRNIEKIIDFEANYKRIISKIILCIKIKYFKNNSANWKNWNRQNKNALLKYNIDTLIEHLSLATSHTVFWFLGKGKVNNNTWWKLTLIPPLNSNSYINIRLDSTLVSICRSRLARLRNWNFFFGLWASLRRPQMYEIGRLPCNPTNLPLGMCRCRYLTKCAHIIMLLYIIIIT